MEPIRIELEYPIQGNGEEVTCLVISRRPRTADLKAMDGAKGEIAKTAALLGRLTDLPPSSIDQLDAADFTKAAEVVGDFLS